MANYTDLPAAGVAIEVRVKALEDNPQAGNATAIIVNTADDLSSLDLPDGSLAFARQAIEPQPLSFPPQDVADYMAENNIDPSDLFDPGQLPNLPSRPANLSPPVTLRLSQAPAYQDVPLGQESIVFAREGTELIQLQTRSDFFTPAREYTFALGVIDAVTAQNGKQLVYSWNEEGWLEAVDGPIGGPATTYLPATLDDLTFTTDLLLLIQDGDVPEFWKDVLLEGDGAPAGVYIRLDGAWKPACGKSACGDIAAFLGGAF